MADICCSQLSQTALGACTAWLCWPNHRQPSQVNVFVVVVRCQVGLSELWTSHIAMSLRHIQGAPERNVSPRDFWQHFPQWPKVFKWNSKHLLYIHIYTRDGHGSIFLHPTQPNPSTDGPNPTQPTMLTQGPNPTHPSHTYVKCRHQYCRTHIFTCPSFHNYVSSKIKGRECLYLLYQCTVQEAKKAKV